MDNKDLDRPSFALHGLVQNCGALQRARRVDVRTQAMTVKVAAAAVTQSIHKSLLSHRVRFREPLSAILGAARLMV